MIMADVPAGEVCFMFEKMDGDEVRETYFLRTENGMALYGCIQGEGVVPRFKRLTDDPHEYPLVPKLPVKPINESRWWNFR
jgi:hypothetical protein